MLKSFFAALLLLLPPAAVVAENCPNDYHEPAAALLEDTQSWLQRANLWNLVTRGEELRGSIRIEAVRSSSVEAWVCGAQKICVSTRLLEVFSPAEERAALAHEIGHLLIPRTYEAHPQLWEAQCDLFAVALLRDMEVVKQMLVKLGNDCRNCSDAEHPLPATRAVLLNRLATVALQKVQHFDDLRGRDFVVQLKQWQTRLPAEWRRLNFAVKARAQTAWQLDELKALNFQLDLKTAPQLRLNKPPDL